MKYLTTWVGALALIVLLAGTASAAEKVASGKVKSVLADKKEFVLTDSAGKDWTFNLGDKAVIDRNGKESLSDLKAGDAVDVCYDKGVLTWTAEYILVKEGSNKHCELVYGAVKNSVPEKKQVTFTDADGKDWTFDARDATMRLNMKDCKMEDVKIGDHALAILNREGDKATLKSLMITRK